jgi:molecular chaperone DnaJ
VFHREENDLFAEVPVPFPTMSLGGSFQVDAPTGTVDVHVSAGTENGTVVSFRGKGMPNIDGRGRGALHIRLVTAIPRKLTKEQKKLVEQLGKTMTVAKIEAAPLEATRDKPFFEKVKDLFG